MARVATKACTLLAWTCRAISMPQPDQETHFSEGAYKRKKITFLICPI